MEELSGKTFLFRLLRGYIYGGGHVYDRSGV
jgi:hypothetical protein